MAGQIPQDVIDTILHATDIVELISEYVPLKRSGKEYLGLCPFHSEKTPSFTVNPGKQIFYCFGCHTGGNVLSFLMKKENAPFPEALASLAERAGISLPQQERSQAERDNEARQQRCREVLALAAGYFQERLKGAQGREAMGYLQSRDLDGETISRFGLGYAPQGWSGLLSAMKGRGVSALEMETAGLAIARNVSETEGASRDGTFTHYDRFRNRIIFTIKNVQGRVIAFGGRVLDDALPKYLNSPESVVFNKSRCLYALDLAVQGIRAQGYALLMEGYMDVITAHRMGYPMSVASLGTALTHEQARLLKRYTTRVVICYDGDNAGVQAAVRAGEILAAEGLDAFVVDISPAKDPDEFLKSASAQQFEARVRSAVPYLEFKFKRFLLESLGRSAQDKARLIQRIAPEILKIKSAVVRESMERFIAKELDITYEAVREELFQTESNRKRNKKNRIPQEDFLPIQDISVRNRNTIEEMPCVAEKVPTLSPPGVYGAEQLILRILLEEPDLKDRVREKMDKDSWSMEAHKILFDYVSDSETPADLNTLYAALAAEKNYEEIGGRLAEILKLEYAKGREAEMLNDCLICLTDAHNKEEIEKMQIEAIRLENSGDVTGAMIVLQQIGERLRRG